ncbi:MAG: tetratricopeptide repeat protein, partial [Pedobacter sp.]
LPGKAEGQAIAYQLIFERPAGEVQFISCSSNQVSFEGSQWGGGRGLFSWHLINGLKGMADTDPEDGEVTIAELYDYVKKNVNRASYDKEAKTYLQTPRYCCTTLDGMVLSQVSKTEKEKLAAILEKGNIDGMTKGGTMLAVNKGGGLEEEIKKAGLEAWYTRYKKAMNADRLIGDSSAYELLKPILTNKKLSKSAVNELKFELSSLLMGDVAKVINVYFTAAQNNNLYTFKYFNTAAQKLIAFKSIADTAYYNPLDVEVNRLFLEGHSYWRSDRTIDQLLSMRKIDSAIALKPQAAYLYNLKGIAHTNLSQHELAEIPFRKAINLAPNWVYPVCNLGLNYTMRGDVDSALKYYHKALQIDSNFQIIYSGLSAIYEYNKQDVDSAVYFIKEGLKVDPMDPYLYTAMGHIYLRQGKYEEALTWYHKGIAADSTVLYPNEGAMQAHVKLGAIDSTNYYVDRMLAMDPDNPVIYESIGNLTAEYHLDSLSYKLFELAVGFDSSRISSWIGFSEAAGKLGLDTVSLGAMIIAYNLDTSNTRSLNGLGHIFYNRGDYETALGYFFKAFTRESNNNVYIHNVGEAGFQMKEYE